MRREPVEHKSLKSVAYQPVGGVLEVELHTGIVLRFFGVSRAKYEALCQDKSESWKEVVNGHSYRTLEKDEAESHIE